MELFRNLGDGTFEDISTAAGLAQIPLACRRGAAFGDVNNDGSMDIVILNVGEPPTPLINHTKNSNHRVLFKLVSTKSNRAAIRARDNSGRRRLSIQRSSRRKQLPVSKRPASAFWAGRSLKN
jgi:hypothetical protein